MSLAGCGIYFFLLATFLDLSAFGFLTAAAGLLVFFALDLLLVGLAVLLALAAGLALPDVDFFAGLALLLLTAGVLRLLAVAGLFFLATAEAELALASLNEPLAPVPLVWISEPLATPDFSDFLMNGASLATSTLYVLAIVFLIALSDEPLRPFSSLIDAWIMSAVGG